MQLTRFLVWHWFGNTMLQHTVSSSIIRDSSIYSLMLPKTMEHSTIIISFVVLFTSLPVLGSGRFVRLIQKLMISIIFSQSLIFIWFIFCLQPVFIDDPELIIEDVDFCKTHLSLIVKQMQSFKICVVDLPLKTEQVKAYPTWLLSSSRMFLCE